MPGHNCAFNQCGTSRRIKHVGSFKVLTTKAGNTKSSDWQIRVSQCDHEASRKGRKF